MSSFLLNNPKKFQRKNLNKFIYLKKKYKDSNLITQSSGILNYKTLELIEFLLKKRLSLKNLKITGCNKTKTKKPLGSKLGSGKGKIDSFFKVLRKYQPVVGLNKFIILDSFLKNINKIL